MLAEHVEGQPHKEPLPSYSLLPLRTKVPGEGGEKSSAHRPPMAMCKEGAAMPASGQLPPLSQELHILTGLAGVTSPRHLPPGADPCKSITALPGDGVLR